MLPTLSQARDPRLTAVTRIAILDDYQNVALDCADWEAIPGSPEIVVFREHLADEDAVAEALADFDVVVAMRERTPFPASLIERLPKLRLLITTGMRNLAIDMGAAAARGVPVCGTALLPYAAFEHAWALILALVKRIAREDRLMREGGWQAGVSEGLHGKTLGVLGLGKLGAKVARVAHAFDMRVIAWSQNMTDAQAAEHGATRVEKDDLFREADIVTIHLILSERTRGLVGARELSLMKPNAMLVNTSRGPIVDEAALIEALRAGRIAGAGLDVYDTEPLPADHPLRDLANTVLTGHTGYVMLENYELSYSQAVEDIRAWLAGDPVRVLNDVGERT
ncbi:MAG: D-2-hydroxyacid dehydrogenase family protein [Gammaproteobacteria bacterium]|nr:D-2-hydroxyacid dehydrogenase family protein [Gammaproteobacteria bacterium]NIM74419.1 D-2-hydroxyacid dehydrogenase family protein [Gammaproteobacteria bacterium]NIO26190.1 D-2-hydroxyacid dehydrogenase family protein [Gammaproteobacteria bacterium]NIO66804.1 D-2-hydroxyacid dehydrogenase family protein [Gammaproteobacteria bacterium]NIP46114.1 D-2-hydroxyacid dehydrogenase family protein [Gammaproteobacteria bacterium]